MLSVSIDIGSTYTKGALFEVGQTVTPISRAIRPTSVDELSDAFFGILSTLDPDGAADVVYSSSAKGGLSVVAIGVVPDLTARMAKEAALSAGAKVTRVFAYKLTEDDLQILCDHEPDIVLFTGGIDGGNEDYIRHNATMLADIDLPCPVIYAGNRTVASFVEKTLKRHELIVCDNVLPEIDRPDPEPARQAIRQIFLDNIVKGKGLDRIAERVNKLPKPTPLAMLELIQAMAEQPDAGDFCVIDLGGATTDFYSACAPGNEEANEIVRGLPELRVKRTVEGDLGLRVSAGAALIGAQDAVEHRLAQSPQNDHAFRDYIARVARNTESLPSTPIEDEFDAILAKACVETAIRRHAGTARRVFTIEGERIVRRGRDLRKVTRLIGTGGYLSGLKSAPIIHALVSGGEHFPLLPEAFDWSVDEHYFMPLLANLAADHPRAAATCTWAELNEISRT